MSGISRMSVWLVLGLFLCGCPAPEIPASFFTVQSPDTETGNEVPDADENEDTGEEDTLAQDTKQPEEDGQDAQAAGKDSEGPDEPECTTIQDCIADGEVSPCLQPTCLAGVCGEVPVQLGTECPLAEGLSPVCGTAACNAIGECVPTFEEEGTSCSEEGAVEQCSSATCDGAGACVTNIINEGQRCGTEKNCMLSFCVEGECTESSALCDDKIECTRNECREVLCSDDSLEECELNIRIQKDDGTFVEGTGALVCVPVPEIDPDAPSCENQCGGDGAAFGNACFCDDACFSSGDCCQDVCDHCGELTGCLGQNECVSKVCKPGFIGHPGADEIGCIEVAIPRDEVLAETTKDGFQCGFTPEMKVCDDSNSCTVETCNASGIPGTDGCEQEVKAVDDWCSNVENCSSVTKCILDPTVEAGVSCPINPFSLKVCESSTPCISAVCDTFTGECSKEASFETNETVACQALDGSSTSCSEGACVACEEGEPGCNVAKCVSHSPYGVKCTTDSDCASLDGFDWVCLGDQDVKVCSLPCTTTACKECMNTNDFRGTVFEQCSDTCGAQDALFSIDDTFLPSLGGVIYDECVAGTMIESTKAALVEDLEKCIGEVELSSTAASSMFGAPMYSCQESSCNQNAPLCYCDNACLNQKDCCPNACSDCGIGEASLPGGGGICYAPMGGPFPEWLAADAIGFGHDHNSCVSCMADAAASYMVDSCGAICNQCTELAPLAPNGAPPLCGKQSSGPAPFHVVTTCVQPCPAEAGAPATQCTDGDCVAPPSILSLP